MIGHADVNHWYTTHLATRCAMTEVERMQAAERQAAGMDTPGMH